MNILYKVKLIVSRRPKVYWFSLIKEKGSNYENYGDIITPYLVEKLTGKSVLYFNPSGRLHKFVKHSIMIGSIIDRAKETTNVWGSGIIRKEQFVKSANFLAVRGPLTRKRLNELGYCCPKIYGDPALLMSKIYNPSINKKYKYGIVPHYVDYDVMNNMFTTNSDINVINLKTLDVEITTNEIIECEYIISTSLHGLIVSDSYNIPNVWLKISNNLAGDDIKFKDYFLSVGRDGSNIVKSDMRDLNQINFENVSSDRIKTIQNELLSVFPYKLKNKICEQV